jgi:hypothetical protein
MTGAPTAEQQRGQCTVGSRRPREAPVDGEARLEAAESRAEVPELAERGEILGVALGFHLVDVGQEFEAQAVERGQDLGGRE